MQWEVSAEESGITLLAFLKSKLDPTISARKLKKALESNLCQVNSQTERFASTLLGVGDKISFLTEKMDSAPSPLITFEASRVLYNDQDIFIYDKPSGIPSDSEDLKTVLQHDCSSPLILVHRLDRETSGVLIFAKSQKIFDAFVALFKQLLVNKTYLALADGVPSKKKGSIDNTLGILHRYQGQLIIGEVPPPHGLRALTTWECVKSGNSAFLVRCFPKTGRTHQIRVHLNGIGHPILGDHHYGRQFRCTYQPTRCLLHASTVSFPHPATKEMVTVTAPLPDDINQAIEILF